jgi:hypothetical protein
LNIRRCVMEVTLFKVKAKHVIIFFAEVEEIIFCVGIMFVLGLC